MEFFVVFLLVSAVVALSYLIFGKESNEKSYRLLPDGWSRKIDGECPPFAVKAHRNKTLLVGGGGGDSNTGVPNHLVLYRLKDGALRPRCVIDTGKNTIFQIAYHPTQPIICCSVGLETWLMRYSSRGIKQLCAFVTTDETAGKHPEQKMAMFAQSGKYLITAGTDGFISFYQPTPDYTSVSLLHKKKAFDEAGELRDCHVNEELTIVIATSKQECKVWKVNELSLGEAALHFKPNPRHEFAGCRLSVDGREGYISEILPRKSSFVRMFPLGAPSYSSVQIFSGKHHTAMDMSDDGKFLVFGNPLGEVAVVSTESQKLVMPPTSTHGFCITGVTICNPWTPNDPKSPFTISCALDRSVSIQRLSDNVSQTSSAIIPTSILVFLTAAGYQAYLMIVG